MSSLYDENMGAQSIDVSSTNRMFQASVIVVQDPEKSGILSFLETVEVDTPPPPTQQTGQTFTPTSSGGTASGGGGGGAIY